MPNVKQILFLLTSFVFLLLAQPTYAQTCNFLNESPDDNDPVCRRACDNNPSENTWSQWWTIEYTNCPTAREIRWFSNNNCSAPAPQPQCNNPVDYCDTDNTPGGSRCGPTAVCANRNANSTDEICRGTAIMSPAGGGPPNWCIEIPCGATCSFAPNFTCQTAWASNYNPPGRPTCDTTTCRPPDTPPTPAGLTAQCNTNHLGQRYVNLTWNTSNGANSYQVRVENDTTHQTVVNTSISATASPSYTVSVTAAQTYQALITAVNQYSQPPSNAPAYVWFSCGSQTGKACNTSCQNNNECLTGYCHPTLGLCRNSLYPESASCQAPTPTPGGSGPNPGPGPGPGGSPTPTSAACVPGSCNVVPSCGQVATGWNGCTTCTVVAPSCTPTPTPTPKPFLQTTGGDIHGQ